MRKARARIGLVVQIPVSEYAPFRHGWNGWLFQAGIVKALGRSNKTGKSMVQVEYPTRNYGAKFKDFRDVEHESPRTTLTKWFNADCVFENDMFHSKKLIENPREYYCNGCYDADTEFLIDKGILVKDSSVEV